ncbi:LysR family transcriptional regulator [Paraburkholderia sp. 5N]|uniref:LysR family transcriptional regulator n=2 Tax=Paraburkholderia elongata TaxID=2675747 RepID=A0A972NWR5_9BURK|nr:LysR family transcriptional regulator [Paraburkholderia elongata]
MDTLMSLRVFCTVAEAKGFAAAADRLGISPAMTSKHVIHLEGKLATRLLHRTSRHVSLTEAGVLYFQQAKALLDGLDEVEAAMANVTVVPRGTLRFSAPVWFANTNFARMVAKFSSRYPDVVFDIDLTGRIANLVEDGLDLALRTVDPMSLDPSLVARRLGDVSFQLAAAPTYLDRVGRPSRISDLNGHALLRYNAMRDYQHVIIEGPNGPETVGFRSVMESSNDTMLQLAAIEGMGIVFLPRWMIEQEVADGRLEILFPESAQIRRSIFAVYPSRKYLSAKVRLFIEFLVDGAGLGGPFRTARRESHGPRSDPYNDAE